MCVFSSELSAVLCSTFLPWFLYTGKINESWDTFHVFYSLSTEATNKCCDWKPDCVVSCLCGLSSPGPPMRYTAIWALEQKSNCPVGTDSERTRPASSSSKDMLCGHLGVMTHASFSRLRRSWADLWSCAEVMLLAQPGVCTVSFRSLLLCVF